MGAAQYNFDIEQGATYSLGLRTFFSNGMVMDLSDYAPFMQIRSKIGGILVLDMAGSDFFQNEDLANGYFMIYIGATKTKLLLPGRYVYDLEVHHSTDDDDVIRLLEGEVTVRGEVTEV